jgi:hypothetical protein
MGGKAWLLRSVALGATTLLTACGGPTTGTGTGTAAGAAPPPAPNTGLLRPSLELDPGIRAPMPAEAPATTPVIPPNPRLDAR